MTSSHYALALAVDITYLLPTREVVDLDYVSLGFGLQYKF
jgi:hypothetical protein